MSLAALRPSLRWQSTLPLVTAPPAPPQPKPRAPEQLPRKQRLHAPLSAQAVTLVEQLRCAERANHKRVRPKPLGHRYAHVHSTLSKTLETKESLMRKLLKELVLVLFPLRKQRQPRNIQTLLSAGETGWG